MTAILTPPTGELSPATTPSSGVAPTWPPTPRGPLSGEVIDVLFRRPASTSDDADAIDPATVAAACALPAADLLADGDVQLAFFLLSESTFGLEGADARWEHHPALASARRRLTEALEAALRATYGAAQPGDDDPLPEVLQRIAGDADPRGLAGTFSRTGTRHQLAELLILRSPYQLKEADPHTLVIPRLRSRAKAALVEIQYDEYGGAHHPLAHQALFADVMVALGLDVRRYAYLDAVPTVALAQVNALTLLCLNGWLHQALAGHFAVFELGSSIPMNWYARGAARLGLSPAERAFFEVHVEADAVHEQVAMHDLCGGLVEQDPAARGDVLFGARVSAGMDEAVGRHVLGSWARGESALRDGARVAGLADA